MGSTNSIPNMSSTSVQWMWNSNTDPFSESQPAEWSPYSDIENMIIEEAFTAGQTHAILDDYNVDFKHKIQILNNDHSKQRPVKRLSRNRNDNHIREERFTYTPISPKHPFAGLYGWISPFLRETVKYLNITYKQLPSKDEKTVPMVVEKAAAGIIREGKIVGKQVQAKKLAKILMEKKRRRNERSMEMLRLSLFVGQFFVQEIE